MEDIIQYDKSVVCDTDLRQVKPYPFWARHFVTALTANRK